MGDISMNDAPMCTTNKMFEDIEADYNGLDATIENVFDASNNHKSYLNSNNADDDIMRMGSYRLQH